MELVIFKWLLAGAGNCPAWRRCIWCVSL